MRTAFSKAKEAVDADGIPMINFTKWAEFYTCLKDVLRHKPPDVSKYRQTTAGVLAYLEQQLGDISLGPTMDQDLEKRSHKLCEEEDQIDRLGTHRLKRANVK